MWIQVESPAPVLNTPDFEFAFGGKNGNEIPLTEKGHPHLNEFVALPGALFEVVREFEGSFILEVTSPLYPNVKGLYIDRRFAKEVEGKEVATLEMPTGEVLLERMQALLGTPYLWGGNWSRGIPEMLKFYPPKGSLEARMEMLWAYRGVDCSGLLYEASRGASPRNTKELRSFGKELELNHLQTKEIIKELRPLDMILTPGHVIFVQDESHTIESKSPFGVITQEIEKRFEEIRTVDFMIRRFVS